MNNNVCGKEGITTEPNNIKMMIWQYYKQLYANTFDN